MIRKSSKLLITGGLGFIGGHFIRYLLSQRFFALSSVINIDKISYASTPRLNKEFEHDTRYQFIELDLLDRLALNHLFQQYSFDIIIHFAAESHVDRSIHNPHHFVQENILSMLNILEAIRIYQPEAHLHQVSTDEVFGAIPLEMQAVSEFAPYSPSNPYSASKASADQLLFAYAHTYKLSTTISYGSNTYGPNQYPEKFIPLMIQLIKDHKTLPIYGNGLQRRRWLYVIDHVEAIMTIILHAQAGSRYHISCDQELTNLALLDKILHLSSLKLNQPLHQLMKLKSFISDRPGHDQRYATSTLKIGQELGWKATITLDQGLPLTIDSYLSNTDLLL